MQENKNNNNNKKIKQTKITRNLASVYMSPNGEPQIC